MLRVLAFARLRELLGDGAIEVDLAPGGTAADLWAELRGRAPQIAPLADSTRIARNGRIVASNEVLCDGDEIALLPPVGGG